MAEQQRKSKPTSKTNNEQSEEVELKSDEKKSDEIKEGLDDLLDEIDGVLETNAEEFVKNYVQKGGQ
jgi:ubiquitin-like protein Pup